MLSCLGQATICACLAVPVSLGAARATERSFSRPRFTSLWGHSRAGFGAAVGVAGREQDQASGADACACWRGGRGRRGPDGALCSCGGLRPRSQQDGGAGPGSELGFGCLSSRGGWSLAGQRRTRFPPTSLVPAGAFRGRGHSQLPPLCGCWVLPDSSHGGRGGQGGDWDISVPMHVAQPGCAAEPGPGRMLGCRRGHLTVFPALKLKGSACLSPGVPSSPLG